MVIDEIMDRGGRVKNLYGPDGKKISYYQINATFFSALGEDERKLRLARAIQMFMPGLPQVWYLDLFAGKNDYAAADAGGAAGHKEINRTTLWQTVISNMDSPVSSYATSWSLCGCATNHPPLKASWKSTLRMNTACI